MRPVIVHPAHYGLSCHVSSRCATCSAVRLLDRGPFHLVGHSMGGALAALYTAKHPRQVRSLTLLAPAGPSNTIKGYPREVYAPRHAQGLLSKFHLRHHIDSYGSQSG